MKQKSDVATKTRALDGATGVGAIASTAVATNIQPPKQEDTWNTYDILERVQVALAKRARCLEAAAQITNPGAALKRRRAAWRSAKKATRFRARARLRDAAEGGAGGRRACRAGPLLTRSHPLCGPTGMVSLDRRVGSRQVGHASRVLLQRWEARAAADRPDATDRAPIASFAPLESSRNSRVDAAPGQDGVLQGSLEELRLVHVHQMYRDFRRRLQGLETQRAETWADSVLALLPKPRKDMICLEHWRLAPAMLGYVRLLAGLLRQIRCMRDAACDHGLGRGGGV